MGNQGGEFLEARGCLRKNDARLGRGLVCGNLWRATQNHSDRVTQTGQGFQAKTHNKMTTSRDCSRSTSHMCVEAPPCDFSCFGECVQPSNIIEGGRVLFQSLFSYLQRKGEVVGKSHTCQISSELP